jgi:hypothetical protein
MVTLNIPGLRFGNKHKNTGAHYQIQVRNMKVEIALLAVYVEDLVNIVK